MKRVIAGLGVGLLLLTSGVGSASGKEMILRVEACGRAECNVRSSQTVEDYALLNPAIETGRASDSPTPSPSYSIRIFLRGAGTSHVLARYHPIEGSLQVKGRRGPRNDEFQVLVPRRWVGLDGNERSAYDELTTGLEPKAGVRAADLAAAEDTDQGLIAQMIFGASSTVRSIVLGVT